MTIPTGWHDNAVNGVLTDPNGVTTIGAVRTTILAEYAAGRWQADDVIVGTLRVDQHGASVLLEDGRWGHGDIIFSTFHVIIVAWNPEPAITGGVQKTNEVIVAPSGTELFWARQQITAMAAQLTAAKQPQSPNIVAALGTLSAFKVASAAMVDTVVHDLGGTP